MLDYCDIKWNTKATVKKMTQHAPPRYWWCHLAVSLGTHVHVFARAIAGGAPVSPQVSLVVCCMICICFLHEYAATNWTQSCISTLIVCGVHITLEKMAPDHMALHFSGTMARKRNQHLCTRAGRRLSSKTLAAKQADTLFSSSRFSIERDFCTSQCSCSAKFF